MSPAEVHAILAKGLESAVRAGERVLVIIPDSTRTAPLPLLFRLLNHLLRERVAALDFLVALGTHPLMSEEARCRLVGITTAERATTYAGTRIFNHHWEAPETFVTLGVIPA
ncbi:MAG: DUF2088 domain-containing protein, partial [Anaerolineae bacterium]|nr:DUF2088 domain-containing protein [Anaerolineae bacterium]